MNQCLYGSKMNIVVKIMGENLFLLIEIVLTSIVAVLLGKYSVKINQEKCCPYCSCKDCCKHGQGIEQKCKDEELTPFACEWRGN